MLSGVSRKNDFDLLTSDQGCNQNLIDWSLDYVHEISLLHTALYLAPGAQRQFIHALLARIQIDILALLQPMKRNTNMHDW